MRIFPGGTFVYEYNIFVLPVAGLWTDSNTAIMKKACVGLGTLGLLSGPLAGDAFHPAAGGLPCGARGSIIRRGEGGGSALAASTTGFDVGQWFRQAFNLPTKGAVEAKEG